MLRNALNRYALGCVLAIAVLALILVGFMNVPEGGVMWLVVSSPAYVASELIKAILFFFLLWYLNRRLKGFAIGPRRYFLYGVFFGITMPFLLVVAKIWNDVMMENPSMASIVGWSAWSHFAAKQVVSWFVQGAIAMAIVAIVPLRRSDEVHGNGV